MTSSVQNTVISRDIFFIVAQFHNFTSKAELCHTQYHHLKHLFILHRNRHSVAYFWPLAVLKAKLTCCLRSWSSCLSELCRGDRLRCFHSPLLVSIDGSTEAWFELLFKLEASSSCVSVPSALSSAVIDKTWLVYVECSPTSSTVCVCVCPSVS